MGVFDLIFKKKYSTASHISFRIFGIKLHILRPTILKERKKFAKYYHSFANANDIPQSTGNLRLIQESYCGFLKTLDEIMTQNNLTYWLDFGTLIGAIRHQGFIPWDDDVDISMPRADYEKFIEKFINGFENHPNLKIKFENNHKNKCFIKFIDTRTDNLCIDIFPYDFYHSELNEDEKVILSQKIEFFRKRKKYINSDNEIRNDIQKITKEIILENKEITSEYPAIFMGLDFPHAHKNKVFAYDEIFPIQRIKYENIELNVPNNPDKVLKREFGNYMGIPKDTYPRHSGYCYISEDEKLVLESYINKTKEKNV